MTHVASGPSQLLAAVFYSTNGESTRILRPWLGIADMVHVLALRDAHLIPDDACRRLLRILVDMMSSPDETLRPAAHLDGYDDRDQVIRGLLPDDAPWLWLDRTRDDANAVAFQLAFREALLGLHSQLDLMVEASLRSALEHSDTWWPSLTAAHPGEVSNVGVYLLAFAREQVRHLDRVRSAHSNHSQAPLHAGAATAKTGSSAVSYRKRLAIATSASASNGETWSADVLLDAGYAAAQVTLTLGRLASDFQILAGPQLGHARLHDMHTRNGAAGSEWRRPLALSVLRGGSHHTVGRVAGLMTSMQSSYREQDDVALVWGEILELVAYVGRLTALGAEVVGSASFDGDRTRPIAAGTTVAPRTTSPSASRFTAEARRVDRLLTRARSWRAEATAASESALRGVVAEATAIASGPGGDR